MTCLSVSFKATLKAMNANKCHIHVLLQLHVKNAGTILFLNNFPDNSLMHLGRNDYNFRAYCKFGKSVIAKIAKKKSFFIFDPKPRNILNKAKEGHFKQDFACHILGGLS